MRRLACLLLIGLLLPGCQPTPDRDPVVNRGDGTLTQAIERQRDSVGAYEAPSRWEETVPMKTVTIQIDADVAVPDMDTFPVQTLRRHTFTQSDALSLLNACFDGPFELRKNRYSTAELIEEIQFVLRGSFADIDDVTGEITWTPFEDEAEQLAVLQRQLEQCPSVDEFIPLTADALCADGAQNVIRTADGTLLYLSLSDYALTISVTRNQYLQDEATVWGGGFAGEAGHALEHIVVTEAEAKAAGETFLERASLAGDFGIGAIEKARLAKSVPTDAVFSVLSEGYTIRFARTGGGYVPFPYSFYREDSFGHLGQTDDEAAYVPRWEPDAFELYVSERGVQAVAWYNPNEVVATSNENVSLLPFEDIQTQIKDNLYYSYAWTQDGGHGVNTVTVKRVALSCAITRIPNNQEEALLSPTWVVVLNNNRAESVHFADAILLINAIDGSYQRLY